MYAKISFSIVFLLLFIHVIFAQEKKIQPQSKNCINCDTTAVKSTVLNTKLFKEIFFNSVTNKWAASVKTTFSRNHYSQEIIEIKKSKEENKIKSLINKAEIKKNTQVFDPNLGINFEANWSLNGTPSDNTMAISNGGYIVTANNDGIEYYNSSGTYLYFDFWYDFFNDNTLTSSLYDPKLIYDSGSDRFVLVVLHGSSANTSKVIVCFSKTNNPQDGWWVYKLTGNPLNNNCWFDYPSIGVSNNEIYITGNLYNNSNAFNQSVVYQIPKYAGYVGNSINWQYWSNLNSNPYPAMSLVPASFGHQGNYGPGIFFVSNKFSGDNRIRLWDLTDDMSGNPQLNSYIINSSSYSPSPDAFQLGSTDRLSNGDCRIQNAFYLNGTIHYVFHSDIGSGWNGVNYNRITVSSLTNQSSTFGLQNSCDFSYPSVVPFSSSTLDKSVMIAFLSSSSFIYPQIRVVNCDNNFQWSSSKLVKAGETYVNLLNGNERWGDYIGISRKHNSTIPRIWLSGCYGANISSYNKFNTFKTWVSEIYGTPSNDLSKTESNNKFTLFPNPVYDFLYIIFNAQSNQNIIIKVIDINGNIVKVLYNDIPRNGENKLTFNKGALSVGTYFINISSDSQTLINEKIIISD